MDQKESARSINISSSRYSDKFQPQLIQINEQLIQKNVEKSEEFSPIDEISQDDIIKDKQQRQNRGNVKNSQITIYEIFQINFKSTSLNQLDKVQMNFFLKFKNKLSQLGHLYPRKPNEKLSHLLEEQYIHQNHNYSHSKFNQQEQKFDQGFIDQYQNVENIQQGIKIPIINPTGNFIYFGNFYD